MKLVDLKEYSEELSLLIDDDIRNHDGYKISSFEDANGLLNDCIDIIEHNSGFFWGILIEGRLAGFFGFYSKPNENNEHYFLTRTYLLREYRSIGLNKKLKTIISDVFNHYRTPLYARVNNNNQRSIMSIIKSQGVFQYFDGDLIVFLLSYGELITEQKLKTTVNRIAYRIDTLSKTPLPVCA